MNKEPETYLTQVVGRYDDNGMIKYFSASDFPGLLSERVGITDKEGIALAGYYYCYPNCRADRLVVFSHGMGGGHRSYMREIERICREGYRVLAYDAKGCFESGGEGVGSITTYAENLGLWISFAEDDGRNAGCKITLIGHSAGGYAVGLNADKGKNIDSAVILSGFVSLHEFLDSYLNQYGEETVRAGIDYETKKFPTAPEEKITEHINGTDRPVLYIQSEDDTIVPARIGIDRIERECAGTNVTVIRTTEKGHNPNYTEDSVKYMNGVFGEYISLVADGTLDTVEKQKEYMGEKDFYRMTEQDESIWKLIFDFID